MGHTIRFYIALHLKLVPVAANIELRYQLLFAYFYPFKVACFERFSLWQDMDW